jgi:hypothetical protein
MGWDGGERESGDRQRVKRCVRFVCNAFDSVAEMCGVDRERKEKKRRKKELRVIEMNQCRKRKSLRVLRLVLMTDMPAMRVEWPFQDPDMDSCTCCFYTQWIDSC